MIYSDEGTIKESADLFGRYRIIKGDKPESERAGLIRFFTDKLGKEPKVMAIRLSHFKIDELYALQSGFNDRIRTHGVEVARKWFWWITRTKKTLSPTYQKSP